MNKIKKVLKKKSKSQPKAYFYFVGVVIVIASWFVWIGTNDYVLTGEIAVCDSSKGVISQYVSSPEDEWPVYVGENGERISCGLAGSDNVFCDEFLSSLSDCTIVYRHYEEREESDLFIKEYKNNIETVFKTILK